VECLLHFNRFAFEEMPIIGNVAVAIHSFIGVPGGMEHGQRAIRWLSRASWCPSIMFGPLNTYGSSPQQYVNVRAYQGTLHRYYA
jgi:hypothetical protein